MCIRAHIVISSEINLVCHVCKSLVRYLHPTDDELKSLIAKNATGHATKGKGRKATSADSRFVNSLSLGTYETIE